MTARAPTLLLLAALGLGCTRTYATASVDVATSDLSAHVTVLDVDGAITVEVELLGPGPRVDLAPGERLIVHAPASASAPQTDVVLTPKPGEEGDAWIGALPAFAGDLTLELVRVHDRGVDGVTVRVPAPFTVTGPATPTSRGAPLPLTWTDAGAGYDLSLDVKGTCASWSRALSTDVGGYAIQAGVLLEPVGAADQSCPLTVRVTRSAKYESSFGGPGRLLVNATRVRTITVESTP